MSETSETPKTDEWFIANRPCNHPEKMRYDGILFKYIQEGFDTVRPFCEKLEKEYKELVELLRMAKCPDCDGSGAIPVKTGDRQYVTHEMAIDAGLPGMEGSLYNEETWEFEQCQWCYERDNIFKGEKR